MYVNGTFNLVCQLSLLYKRSSSKGSKLYKSKQLIYSHQMAIANQDLEVKVLLQGKIWYLHINGFIYTKHSNGVKGKIYCRCRKKRRRGARATTINRGHTLKLLFGGKANSHPCARSR